ncbi:MAG: ribonuclease HII [Anaerolineae bacterium]|nr:ribonuclease HII [Anaerolineae bacterium]
MRICGMDEAGRGPVAGPLVAAAVVVDEASPELDARDGKTIAAKKRLVWAERLRGEVDQVEYALISVEEINEHGLGWANKEVFRRLIEKIDADQYIVDGNLKFGDMLGEKGARVQCVVRADQHIKVVSAASILAKTHRDQLMLALHEQYPDYAWQQNKGYPTRAHIQALNRLGPTPYHRDKAYSTVKKNLDAGAPPITNPSNLPRQMRLPIELG